MDGDLDQIFQYNISHQTESKTLIRLSYSRYLTALILSGLLRKKLAKTILFSTLHFISLPSSLSLSTFQATDKAQIPNHCIFIWPKFSGGKHNNECALMPPRSCGQPRAEDSWSLAVVTSLGAGDNPKSCSQTILSPSHHIKVGKEVVGDAPNDLVFQVRC